MCKDSASLLGPSPILTLRPPFASFNRLANHRRKRQKKRLMAGKPTSNEDPINSDVERAEGRRSDGELEGGQESVWVRVD